MEGLENVKIKWEKEAPITGKQSGGGGAGPQYLSSIPAPGPPLHALLEARLLPTFRCSQKCHSSDIHPDDSPRPKLGPLTGPHSVHLSWSCAGLREPRTVWLLLGSTFLECVLHPFIHSTIVCNALIFSQGIYCPEVPFTTLPKPG